MPNTIKVTMSIDPAVHASAVAKSKVRYRRENFSRYCEDLIVADLGAASKPSPQGFASAAEIRNTDKELHHENPAPHPKRQRSKPKQ